MMVIKMLAFLPRARAYNCTKGCGAFKENNTSRSGVQKRKRMAVTKPKTPVAMALDKMPRPAITLKVHDETKLNVYGDC